MSHAILFLRYFVVEGRGAGAAHVLKSFSITHTSAVSCCSAIPLSDGASASYNQGRAPHSRIGDGTHEDASAERDAGRPVQPEDW